MSRKTFFLIPLLYLCIHGGHPAMQLLRAQTTAIVNVNVVPMDTERVLTDQTVLIQYGLIREVGASESVQVPADAIQIDGAGRYLMPGLADFHVHLRNEADLPVYLANGVTSLLDMGGSTRLLEWRERIEAGELLGPHLLLSHFIDGGGGRFNKVESEEEARAAIQKAASMGYDYVKVYNSLTTAQFEAIIEEANHFQMAVIGHGVRAPGMEGILESGQVMVAHAEEYIYTFFNNTTNRALIPDAIELTKRTGAFLLPNLSAFEIITVQWGKPAAVDSFLAMPDVQYLHPSFRRSWQGGRYTSRRGSLQSRLVFLRELTKAFSDAGIPLLLGTDSPGIPGMFPGASIHNDLRNMIQAGLTPFEALSAGTRTAGEFVQMTKPGSPVFGVVTEGARADLMLITDNPLSDVNAVKNPLGVMLAGKWWPAEELEAVLDSLYAE